MISVLLVDDYPPMRQLLRDILERYPDIQIVGVVGTAEEAVAHVRTLKPTAVVIDLHLPTMTAPEATTLIKLLSPSTAVIGLTAGAREDAEKAMQDAGAATVLSKAEVVNTLYPAIIEEGMLKKISSRLLR
jgi:DNA-binding NarL/FixJ family response regulator